MQKVLFGIFAHPDDEAFGPSGTLLTEAMSGTEVNLITLTSGNAGANPDHHPDLGVVRLQEWQQAGKLIGARNMYHLGFEDGELSNNSMITIQKQLVELITKRIATDDDIQVEIMTIDLNGITGHIDHIVAARAASFAFYTLKNQGLPLTHIRYACFSKDNLGELNTDWLYMECGHSKDEINETVDATKYIDMITSIIRTHYTQRHDGEAHLAKQQNKVAINHFIVRE